MTDRIPLDAMTSDALDALYDERDRLQQDVARQAQEMATWRATANALDAGAPGTPRARAEHAEAAIARVRSLADRWDNALGIDKTYARTLRAALDEPGSATTAAPADTRETPSSLA